jgi:hypothetical protein
MSKQKVLIDCAKKSVKLTTDDGQDLEYVAEPLVMHKGATNHIKLNQMEAEQSQNIPIVNEYPNVFPEELPCMLPDHDIEFVIELLPGTAPIYKRPYRMSTKQLEELKEQVQELQGKGYICPSSSPWEAPIIFVPKKDGTQRMFVDYRALNEVTINTSILCPRLMIFLINSEVHVYSPRSIFGLVIIN